MFRNDRTLWLKVIADGSDVARCGLSIGVLLASLFHDRQYNGPCFVDNTSWALDNKLLSCDQHVHLIFYAVQECFFEDVYTMYIAERSEVSTRARMS
jgi:hypothetical protein